MSKKDKPFYKQYPITAPRFWHGLRCGDYIKLLARNKFAIHPARWYVAFTVSYFSVLNSLIGGIQSLIYRKKIARYELPAPPIFIVGHWRSGTTFLHDLISLDDNFTYPSTLQCFLPNQFLVTGKLFLKLDKLLIPEKRPQDNVTTSFRKPQEDEFAIFNMGHHSPYLRMAFPNGPLIDNDYLTLENLSEDQVKEWQKVLVKFVKMVSYQQPGKPVVLKSPPHIGRVKFLAEAFPGAKFIHISRDPYSLIPSTVRLWQSLDYIQGFNRPRYDLAWLYNYIGDTFETLYEAFERQREEVDAEQLIDVRYEELVADTPAVIRSIYERLDLGDFDTRIAEPLAEYLESQKSYQVNQHELPAELEEMIEKRCCRHLEKYGYQARRQPH
ncbi:MAG: sulfotransferase [Planctomycetota bacterium]|nr:sulfotransferase [Planctomycetota bacterium]